VPVGLRDPSAAGYLARSIVSATTQLAAIGLATALCIWVAGTRRRTAPVARALLFIAIVLNLFAANRGLNPTMSVSSIGHPAWLAVAHAHPDSRIYSPHPAILPKGDRELPTTLAVHPDMPAPAVTAVYQSTLAGFPTAPGVHSVLAPDLTRLRSVAYTALLQRFATSDPEARDRFLRRVGTRYFLAKDAPRDTRRPLVALDGIVAMTLFEDPAPASRALVVPSARIVPSLGARIGALFSDAFAIDQDVLLDAAPLAAAGVPGPVGPPGATIVEDQPTRVRIAASVPEGGGYVMLLDSHDPNWIAEVDGQPAPLLEADGLFRAVRVAPGHHDVVFRYRSR